MERITNGADQTVETSKTTKTVYKEMSDKYT